MQSPLVNGDRSTPENEKGPVIGHARVGDPATVAQRTIAKAIDFIALAFTIVGFSKITDSYLAGVLIGYGWFALSDAGGSIGKWLTKIEARDARTGTRCSALASTLRNLPIIAVSLPLRLHQGLLDLDRETYRDLHEGFVLLMAALGVIVFVTAFAMMIRNPQRRHMGDLLAGTFVARTSKRA